MFVIMSFAIIVGLIVGSSYLYALACCDWDSLPPDASLDEIGERIEAG